MNTTVTMSLERFKELESAESSLKKITQDENICLHLNVEFGNHYYVPISVVHVVGEIKAEIKEVSDRAEFWRLKSIESEKKPQKRRFRLW